MFAVGKHSLETIVTRIVDPSSETVIEALAEAVFQASSPFRCLALATVCKQFNKHLDNDSFWKEKLVGVLEYDSTMGLPMRSQFVIRAKREHKELKHRVSWNKPYLDELKPIFLGQLEMFMKVEPCIQKEENRDLFYKLVDRKILDDPIIVLELLPKFPHILRYASMKIHNDNRFMNLQSLIYNKPYLQGNERLSLFSYSVNDEQKQLYIQQITQNINENPIIYNKDISRFG